MKDGIYKVVLTIDGVPMEGSGRMKDGVFEGLGVLAGVRGHFDEEGVFIAGQSAGGDRPASTN